MEKKREREIERERGRTTRRPLTKTKRGVQQNQLAVVQLIIISCPMPLTLIRRQSLQQLLQLTSPAALHSPPSLSLSLPWQLANSSVQIANVIFIDIAQCDCDCRLPIGHWRLHCRLHFKVVDPASSSLAIDWPNWPSMSQSPSHITHSLAINAKNSCAMNAAMRRLCPERCCNLGQKQLMRLLAGI